MKEIINAFHNQKIVKVNGHNYLVNPITDHVPDTTHKLLKDVITELSVLTDFSKANRVIGEEDRGGYIAALVAFKNKKSLGMVKWNPVGLEGEIEVFFKNIYTEGKMYLHGCKKGDNVIIVEDLIDSGGTIIGMIEILRSYGANIVDVICIASKAEYGGIEKIKKETGIKPKSLIKFTCVGEKSKVVEIGGKKINL
jgi:adenine/guanine phosphoribosyltransferase-like PRPP-binding protein